MPRARIFAVATVAVLAAAVTSGCSGSAAKSSMASAGASSAAGESSAAGGAEAAPTRFAAAAGVNAAQTSANAVKRAEVVSASMAVTTKHVDQAADRIATLAATDQGRVDGDRRSAGDGIRVATVVVRVTPAQLSSIISAVDRLGTETSRTLTRDDVTTSKADVDARILALSTSITRLQHLLSTASGVGTLLQVEKVLTSRQSDLDSLRAQQRALGDEIALATLTVSLSSVAPVPKKPVKHHFHATGFFSAIGKSVHGLGVAITVVVAAVGYLLPFALPVVVAAAVFVVVRRRRRSAPSTEPATPDPA